MEKDSVGFLRVVVFSVSELWACMGAVQPKGQRQCSLRLPLEALRGTPSPLSTALTFPSRRQQSLILLIPSHRHMLAVTARLFSSQPPRLRPYTRLGTPEQRTGAEGGLPPPSQARRRRPPPQGDPQLPAAPHQGGGEQHAEAPRAASRCSPRGLAEEPRENFLPGGCSAAGEDPSGAAEGGRQPFRSRRCPPSCAPP